MPKPFPLRGGHIALIVLAAAALALGGVFMSRAPVLLVIDDGFTALYGKDRARLDQALVSGRLFRRVIPVPVAEDADADLIAIAVEEAAAAPYRAVFPFRYRNAAAIYLEKCPGVEVRILGGRERDTHQEGVFFINTDVLGDLRRAGLAAAYLAERANRRNITVEGDGEAESAGEAEDRGAEGGEENRNAEISGAGAYKGVIVLEDGWMQEAERGAFLEGLQMGRFEGAPLYLRRSGDSVSYDNYACVVIAGNGEGYFERNLALPVICFSWINPEWLPEEVKLIFDDSPWRILPEAVRARPPALLGPGAASPETRLPSRAVIPKRPGEEELRKGLRAAIGG